MALCGVLNEIVRLFVPVAPVGGKKAGGTKDSTHCLIGQDGHGLQKSLRQPSCLPEKSGQFNTIPTITIRRGRRTSMPDFHSEAKQAVVDTIRRIFDKSRESFETGDPDIPTQKVFTPRSSGEPIPAGANLDDFIEENELVNYKEYLHESFPYDDNRLTKTAELLSNNNTYDVYDIQPYHRRRIYDSEQQEYRVDEELDIFKYDLIELSSRIAESQRNFKFDESYVEDVYFEYLRELRDEPRQHSIYCPIMNLEAGFDSLTLPTDFDLQNTYGRYDVQRSEIICKFPEHLAGFYNLWGQSRIPRTNDRYEDAWTHILKLDVYGNLNRNSPREYIKALGRCFRLKFPETELVYMGPAFTEEKSRTPDKYDYPVFSYVTPPEMTVSTVYTTRTYGLTVSISNCLHQDNLEDFRAFVYGYMDYLNAEQGSQISGALRRYDNMFSHLYLEDILVNCTIGFEGSLLRDINTASSFTFRLKLRSGPLLKYADVSREVLHDFFKSLYYVRGEIVHQDREIVDIIDGVDFQPPTMDNVYPHVSSDSDIRLPIDYTIFSRKMLAQTILRYIDIMDEFGLNVTQVNQLIDEKVLGTGLDFEEFESYLMNEV